MKVLIENYRSYDIEFDTDSCNFTTSIENDSKSKISYDALKKYIDDYLKDNATFEPFKVIGTPNGWRSSKRLTIVGIRKDGRFVGEDSKGKKEQLSDHDMKDFILDLPENDKYYAEKAILELERDNINKNIQTVLDKIKAPTLFDMKSKYFKG